MGSISAYTKNQLMYWLDDKEHHSEQRYRLKLSQKRKKKYYIFNPKQKPDTYLISLNKKNNNNNNKKHENKNKKINKKINKQTNTTSALRACLVRVF